MTLFIPNLRILMLAVAAALLSLLVACGPQYRTEYTLTPPESDAARTCVAVCQGNINGCTANLRASRTDELAQCRMRAVDERDNCLRSVNLRNSPSVAGDRISCGFTYSDRMRQCDNQISYQDSISSICEGEFRSCFRSCGGQVSARTICVANCDKK